MTQIKIRIIDKERKDDINIKNEPFSIFGRMIPTYTEGRWSFTTEKYDTVTEMRFPDENYDYGEMIKNSVFIGAYDGDICIGLANLQEAAFKYMYLYDLKVNCDYRCRHVGQMLIKEAKKITKARGYNGIYTIGQDNNLGACLFYIACGFDIGGLDTNVYKGTSQDGKADIIFYLDTDKKI